MFSWSDIEEIRVTKVLEDEESMIYAFRNSKDQLSFIRYKGNEENVPPTPQIEIHWIDSNGKEIIFIMEDDLPDFFENEMETTIFFYDN